ncbi:YqzH family protein [Bacillus dakarensis]|jgi:hypothetical protein|uniref:YqzH family protein n=1 Tax=Robertmurraya dakarensis TaxID=1926278 RepID=UPI000980F6E8|nr:YqzH family protein [Bacillus dakarensis]
MDKKFIYKMVRNCFKQYHNEHEDFPIKEGDYERLYKKIITAKEKDHESTLHDIINDIVYEFITNE